MTTDFKIWSKFSVTKKNGTIKYRVVETPPQCFDDFAELIITHFIQDEAVFKASGLLKNKEAVAEFKLMFMESLKDGSYHTIVCCLDNDNDEIGDIIAGSYASLRKKGAPVHIKAQTIELQSLIKIINTFIGTYSNLAELNGDRFHVTGIVVHPKYRGSGIAQELFKVWRLIGKEQGVPLTSALMTAYGSQKAAERDGWKSVYEWKFDDVGKLLGLIFEDCPPVAKLMIART